MDRNSLKLKLELEQSKLRNLQIEYTGKREQIETVQREIDEIQKQLQQ